MRWRRGVLTYTVWVTNTGDVELQATITDTLPAEVEPGEALTWTATITTPLGTWRTAFTVTVTSGYSGTLTNRVELWTDQGAGEKGR